MSLETGIALLTGSAAMVEDLRHRTVSNGIVVALLCGGLLCQVIDKGWPGVPAAVLGALSGFGVFLVFYLLGGMGGGDIKLMAGFGALLGVGRLVQAALWTAIIGALLAVIVLAVSWVRRKRDPASAAEPRTIPYAPAIALGVWMALIPTG
jgi:prepilin peptidase CpaA